MAHSNRQRVFSELWHAVWQFRSRTLLALLLLVLAKASGVGVPLILKTIVDSLSRPDTLAAGVAAAGGTVHTVLVVPVFLLLSYAALRFSGTLFTELRDLVFARVSQLVVTRYAERAFAHLLALNPRFHTQRNTGSLIRDIERGTGGVSFLLGAGLFTAVPTLVELGTVLIVMSFGYTWWFTIVMVLTFFTYGTYTTSLTQRRELRQRRVNQVDSTAHGRMVDGLLNYELVKTYAREDFERQRYASVLSQWTEHSVNNQRALSMLHIGQGAIIAAGVSAMMLLAGEQTVRGILTVGDLVLVNAYVIQICLPLNTLGFVFRETRDALVNTENLLALLQQQPDIEDRPGSVPLQARHGEVVFEHVHFAYEPGRTILQDVSFTIGAGQAVAVVGGSGSGKSTLGRLLLRLYDVDSGRIMIDGQDVRGVRMDSLRLAIGVVPQDTTLFNETIGYNIAYGRVGAGMAEVIEAAKAAQVHEFIMSLPQQYDTPVGERGMKLSGGEKQRIAIARAFLKNPPIMIFDEATSALDTRAERAIQNELDRMAQGRTTLTIAHRLSTIIEADQIIVMDKGRIVERGRHDELLNLGGLYTQLWNLQLQQQEFERLERRMARQPINLATLLIGVLDGLRAAIEERQVTLYTQIDSDAARVIGDPSTLAQTLRDLCLNALRTTPQGGRMELRLERNGPDTRLSVTDGRHAAGGESSRPDIDQPLDPLQIRSTIERQGGRFTVEDPAATRGMSYVVELPLRALDDPIDANHLSANHLRDASHGHAGVHADNGRADHVPMLAGMQIMSVDDLDDAREALGLLLESEGAAVQAFDSAGSAVAWLETHPTSQWPHLVLCDIALGDSSGYEVIRRIRDIESQRNIPLGKRVPAVALSGLAGPADRMHSLLVGFQAHLAKPVQTGELLDTLLAVSGRATMDAPSR